MPRLSHRTAHDNRNGRNHVNTVKHMRVSRPALAAAAVIGGLGVGAALSADDLRLADNPFAPAYGHEYRHGAVPTREARLHMDEWDRVHGASAARLRRNTVLVFGGGIDGIGVTSGTPKVYLVFYGSQWTGGGDPNAAAHFGNTTAASNRYAQYVVVSPSGTHPDGFGSANFCAWHSYTTSSYGDLPYTNMPYVTDLGASCGENFVNPGSAGLLDGFSIVNGHEYAETLTDQLPAGGWTTRSGSENGDLCAWISSGQGAAANVSMGNGAYAMQIGRAH